MSAASPDLIRDLDQVHQSVQQYYGDVLSSSSDLRTSAAGICC